MTPRLFRDGLVLGAIAAAAIAAPLRARDDVARSYAPIAWGTLVKATAEAGAITKTAGCHGCGDAGGVSEHEVRVDAGAVQFTPSLGHRIYAGLADAGTTLPSPASLPFAFSFWPDGGWDIRERGTYRSEGRFSDGDVFTVTVDTGAVRYFQNGSLVYTSRATTAVALVFGTTLYSSGAKVTGAVIDVSEGPAPVAYASRADRTTLVEPPVAVIGPAGSTWTEPTFGTTLSRITDANTRPSRLSRSYRTASGSHQHSWSAKGTRFYVTTNDGTLIPFAFDAVTGTATRINPTPIGAGGLTLKFFNEAQFSYVDDDLIYATYNGSGSTLRTVDQYDFSTNLYSRVLDLDAVMPGLTGTLVGGVSSTAGPVEKIMAFFGGSRQDLHRYVVVFEKDNPQQRHVIDSIGSTIDGVPIPVTLNFKLHAVAIDRSGRYVSLYPTAADLAAPRLAAKMYVWDVETGKVTPLDNITARPNGHDAYGFGRSINQDCCEKTTWDAAQWQLRDLSTPGSSRDLILPVLTPKEIYLADHPSWHNARRDALTPFISGTYRYGLNTAPWRAWDNEIIGIETNVATGVSANVWRFAHHRSDVAHDTDPSRINFWYTPRPSVSDNGRWVLFTSNWEKTLGADASPEPGGGFRQDVFLLKLK
jgi:hypothetical protein